MHTAWPLRHNVSDDELRVTYHLKKELITTIDLGPLKHKVDNGAPIRKSAFSLLQNLSEKF